jgi:excisionase family DNA binding protein
MAVGNGAEAQLVNSNKFEAMKRNDTSGREACVHVSGFDFLISKKRAAAILGASTRTVERKVATGELLAHRIGSRAIRFSFQQVMKFAGLNYQPSNGQ